MPADTTGLAARMKAFMREPEIRTVHFNDLAMSDPYIYAEPSSKTYYLTSSGGRMYKSKDLVMWGGPYVSFAVEPGYDYQPHNWDCIDGTLYEEDGKVYMIFVHEWTQLIDGTMDYIELAPDLSYTVSEQPVTMFRASEHPAVAEMNSNGEATFGMKMPGWVTDGPQMFRTQTGRLGMLWASWGKERYIQCVCYSESGTIAGPWVQEPEPFLANNSGHGMLFRTFGGKLIYLVHHSEGKGPRKPQYWNVDDSGDKLVLGERIIVDESFNLE